MTHLLHQSITRSAQNYPDHDAMRFQGASLTYGELERRSNQLAHLLHDQGIGRRDRVGVFLDKSLETPLAIYGIMKAGAAYVPLDPRSPISRLVDIIQDCGIRGIVSQDNKARVLGETGVQQDILQFVVGVSQDADIGVRTYAWAALDALPAENAPGVYIIDQDLAYIMYTSGSTGKPKGIMHTHFSGMSYAQMSADTYDVQHSDRLSNHSPLHFDMSTFDYLTGPLRGATTVIIPEAFTLFPANLAQLIEDERLTIWYSVPFALIQLIERGVMEKRDFTSLRWILYGGEPFPTAYLRTLMERLPGARISNVYGPAEVNQCTFYHLPPVSEWDESMENVPLGRVWDNAEGLILDHQDQEVAPGAIGELVVRTPTMMRGYWNRSEMNRRAFYRREVFPDYHDVYYRTGDLVRLDEQGQLQFLGRKDHQIKIRGYRVELAEVDAALTRHEAVEEGSAYVVNRDAGDVICAAITLKAGKTVSEGDLIDFLKSKLVHYAVPQTIRILESFPRTSTGKVDRKALQQQANAAAPLHERSE